MRIRAKSGLGLWLCIPAMLFFADPNIAFRDFLPDFVGYLLLYTGLSRVAQLNDDIAEALNGFKKMIWISVGAMLVEYYLKNILPAEEKVLNTYESPTLLLLFSFVMLVLKCYFLLPAYRDLFKGLGALADRHGGERIHAERRGKTRTERISRSTKRFVVITSVLSFLPELAVLGRFEYEVENTLVDWFRFVELFRTVAFLISAVIAMIWLIRALRYWIAILRERDMIDILETRYAEETLPNAPMIAWRRCRFAFWFLMLGSVFSIGLRMDESAVLPSVFCALFCIIGVFSTGYMPQGKHRIRILAAGIPSALVSIAANLFNDEYFRLYQSAEASYYSGNAYRYFLTVRILQIVEVVLTLAFLLVLLRWLYAFVKERTYEEFHAEDQAVSKRATERLHRKFRLRIWISVALFAVSSLGQAAERLLCLAYPWLWWISVPLSLAAVISFVALLFAIIDQTEQLALSETHMHKA